MTQKLCLIHANCQGDTLRYLLELTPAFASEYTIQKYTNYLEEEIPQAALDSCQLFLYQHMGEKWGDTATKTLLHRISPTAQTLEIPNMFFNGYWPLWTNNTTMAYGDMLLEELCARDLQPAEILHIYLKGKLHSTYDLQELRTASRQKEEQKEAHQPIKTLDFIEAHWQKEQLFYTINHPAPQLSLYVADKTLQHLGFDGVSRMAREALLHSQEEFILPIHPQIAAMHALPFAHAERLYPVYGQELTFAEYAQAYIQCLRQKGPNIIEDFVVYLHLLAQKAGQHGS